MDFIEGLPHVNGKSVILTIVDRFSKYAHFVPLAHPYTAGSWSGVLWGLHYGRRTPAARTPAAAGDQNT